MQIHRKIIQGRADDKKQTETLRKQCKPIGKHHNSLRSIKRRRLKYSENLMITMQIHRKTVRNQDPSKADD